MAFPDIKLSSSFDSKGFKQAMSATDKLEKNVKNLAKAFGLTFGVAAIARFSKASVKAFAEDDAAAKSLGQTLKNLNLAYGANAGTVNGFISRLETSTGVLDDELRPAMDRLLRATNDVAKSQELLGLALDIAAGTGKSVTQVSQSLQKAYLGQTQALGRLGVGLSKAELTSSSFEEIQARLAELFAGQATRAADSYQGSLNKLQVAANNAKETIGKGLVDALATLSDSKNVDGTVSAIDRIAQSIANATTGFAKFIKVSKDFLGTGLFLDQAEKASLTATRMGTRFTTPMSISSQDTQKADKAAAAAAAKTAAAKIKADKAATAAKIKSDKLAAANKAKLDKAAALFDQTKISIAAALKGKISEEEKIRLLLMQAIEDENGKKAEELQKKLEEIQKKNKEISEQLVYIQGASNPFEAWANSLGLAAGLLKDMPPLFDKLGNGTGRFIKNVPQDPVDPDPVPVEVIPPEGGGKSIFDPSDTIEQIIEKVENVAEEAAAAAQEAAASVQETQKVVDELATAATNGVPVTGSSSMFNSSPYAAVGGPGFGTMNPNISVYIQPQGAIVMPSEVTEFINDAVLEAYRTGYGRTPAGLIG